MKKTLLTTGILMCSFFSTQAQVTILEDGFESYTDFSITNVGNWLTLDLDGSPTYTGGGDEDAGWTAEWANAGDPQAFQVFNPSQANVTNSAVSPPETRNFDPKTGQKYMGSWAAVMPAGGGSGPNNDFLISPVMTLGTSGNQLKFWVKSLSNTYSLETYKVGVYVGNGIPTSAANFTIISGASNLTAPYVAWEEKTFNLDAYAGQTVRIAIQNTSVDHYFFMVDDFKVTATALSVDKQLISQFSVYPNPVNNVVTISNSANATIDAVTVSDLNGRTVKSVKLNGETSAQVNISDLSAGVYMMNISSDQGSVTKKIVKN